jgi:hypothetical protein
MAFIESCMANHCLNKVSDQSFKGAMMSNRANHFPRKLVQSGDRFGRLVTHEKQYRMSGSQKVAYWACQCDCGNVTTVRAANLTNGHTKSCGCLHAEVCADMLRTHGDVGTTTYNRWRAMISRCYFENDTAYAHYGAKGVTVCDEWRVYENFLADMGECPEGLTLDRIDNAKGYSKDNCRWATVKQQANNKTDNVRYTAFGMTLTLAEWADKTKIKVGTLRTRIVRHNWPLDKALTEPVEGRK